MDFSLSPQQEMFDKEVKDFVQRNIFFEADKFDSDAVTPDKCFRALSKSGYLGAVIAKDYGGLGIDLISFGALCRELGRGSASVLSLMTVHSMVSWGIQKWAQPKLRSRLLPSLARGERIAAFCLSEPNVGSDAKGIETSAEKVGDFFILNGTKQWISYAQVADYFLIFAHCNGLPTAFLAGSDCPGLTIKPTKPLIGLRASMLGQVVLENCKIPAENMLARIGFGVSHVASFCLDLGRLSVAWGSLGISQACCDAAIDYANNRKQGGNIIRDYQLIQEMIADMITNIRAMRLLCHRASWLKDTGDPSSIMETCIAKYFCSRMANKCASDALQIHGALGCSADHPIQRYWRDARIMEIIEGSSQIQQIFISNYGFLK